MLEKESFNVEIGGTKNIILRSMQLTSLIFVPGPATTHRYVVCSFPLLRRLYCGTGMPTQWKACLIQTPLVLTRQLADSNQRPPLPLPAGLGRSLVWAWLWRVAVESEEVRMQPANRASSSCGELR